MDGKLKLTTNGISFVTFEYPNGKKVLDIGIGGCYWEETKQLLNM